MYLTMHEGRLKSNSHMFVEHNKKKYQMGQQVNKSTFI